MAINSILAHSLLISKAVPLIGRLVFDCNSGVWLMDKIAAMLAMDHEVQAKST